VQVGCFIQQMSGFSRSMDGLLTGYVQRAAAGAVLTGSDKENTPCDAAAPGPAPASAHKPSPPHFPPAAPPPTGSEEAGGAAAPASDVTSGGGGGGGAASAAMMEFQMPAITDMSRQRRNRSNRKLRNRNSVPEEVIPERGDDAGQ